MVVGLGRSVPDGSAPKCVVKGCDCGTNGVAGVAGIVAPTSVYSAPSMRSLPSNIDARRTNMSAPDYADVVAFVCTDPARDPSGHVIFDSLVNIASLEPLPIEVDGSPV